MSAPASTSHAPKFLAFAVPFLGILGAIQGSSPNVNSTALVSLAKDLGMTQGLVALAASAQTIAIAATVITTGLLADRLGRRKVLLAALLIGASGSAISGLAPVSIVYLLGQVVMGVGMGAVYGSAFGYISAVAKPGKLPAALGVFGASIGLTTVILTFVGGLAVGVNWRLGFFVLAGVSVLAFLAAPWILPKVPHGKKGSLDVVGQLLLGFGIIGFLYGVSQLGVSLTSPRTLIPLVAGAALMIVFFVHESKSKSSFYPVALFRSPIFIAAILAGFIYNFGTAVSFLQTTNLWQYVTGVATRDIALWQLPLTAAGIVSALITGRFMSKGLTNRSALLMGSLFAVAGFVMLALVSSQKSFWAFLPAIVLVGAGVVIVSIPFGSMIIKEAPPDQYGPVTSSRTTIGQFFYSIGFAAATVMVDRLTLGGVTQKLTDAGVQPDSIGTAVTSLNQYVRSGTDPSTQLGKEALTDAVASYSSAFSVVMLVTAGLILVAAIAATALLRNSKSAPPRPESPAVDQ